MTSRVRSPMTHILCCPVAKPARASPTTWPGSTRQRAGCGNIHATLTDSRVHTRGKSGGARTAAVGVSTGACGDRGAHQGSRAGRSGDSIDDGYQSHEVALGAYNLVL